MKPKLTKVLGDPQNRAIKRMKKVVKQINALEPSVADLSDKALKAKTAEFKKRLKDNKKTTLDALLPEAFATAREAAKRVLGQRHFDVQLVGAMVLHEGSIAEMKTGEGKTLVATAPVYLNALSGRGVHIVTVNDYLAQRDGGWMAEVYSALGLTTAVIIADQSFIYDADFTDEQHEDERFQHLKPCTRKEAYAADVTYGTNNEYGFDYLRDNMVNDNENLRQRDLHYAIVDEVDSILVDEARTPLIISAPAAESGAGYALFADIARQLVPDDYELDEKRKTVALTEEGVAKIQKLLKLDNFYNPEHVRLIYHMDQALKAQTLFHRDKDYVVNRDGEVIIVDEFTGRLMIGRRYNEGLHQAIEAKESVDVLQESMTLATISFQNYFRLYEKLSGMTGTAKTEEEEFQQIYDLNVVQVPTNKPIAREDRTDRIYKNEQGKFNALIGDVKDLHKKGQPVLIGTVSIEKNEILSELLTKAKIPHQLLNAKNNEGEATIVAKAGQKGGVTLATNIAGRGTDIVLGEDVRELGGLVVIGSERHESRRIDNQLRGRCGRQGDPGMTQFYVSADDNLMRVFGGDNISKMMDRLGVDEETPIVNRTVSRSLENAQKKVEGYNFDIRKNVVQYDDVMNRHRKAVYQMRRRALNSEDLRGQMLDTIASEAKIWASEEPRESKEYYKELQTVIPLNPRQISEIRKSPSEKSRISLLQKYAKKIYEDREKAFGKDLMRQVEREAFLQILDQLWMQHLENMDHLREGINWRSIGQKDPLVEYRREGQRLFEYLVNNLRREIVRVLNHVNPNVMVSQNVDTELTKAAQSATDNTNEIASGVAVGSEDFNDQDKSAQQQVPKKNKKQNMRKSKKKQRQNRKKGR